MNKYVFLAAVALAMPVQAKQPEWAAKIDGVVISHNDAFKRMWNPAILETMVNETLIRQEAKRVGITADPKEVDSRANAIRQQFSDEASFLEQLKKQGLTTDEFREQVAIRVLSEAVVAKAKNISVTDEEVKAYFDQNREKLGTPEAVHLRQILVRTKEDAEGVIDALDAGADFAKLAAKKSMDEATKSKGGDLGFISRGLLVPEVEKAVFGLKASQHSGIITSNSGYFILQAEETREAQPADFTKLESDLRQAMYNAKINQALPVVLKELRDKAKLEYNQPVFK